MSRSIEEIIGFESLLGSVEMVKNGVPMGLLPAGMYSPALTRTMRGNQGVYTRVKGTRETARVAEYGSPAQKRELQGIAEITITLLHMFEFITHKPYVLEMLREYDSPQVQMQGRTEIDRQTGVFLKRFMNLRESMKHSMFTRGRIDFNGKGDLLSTGTGFTFVDFDVSADHKGDLGGILTDWSNPATSIIAQLEEIKEKAVKDTGYEVEHVLYSKNMLSYLASNNEIANILRSDSGLATSFRMNEIPDGFLGFNWHNCTQAFYTDGDGNRTSWYDENAAIFLPEPEITWYEQQEGTYPVPTSLGIGSDAEAVLANVQSVAGLFSYACVGHNPVCIEHYAGDTSMPVLKVPDAIFIGDVVNP